MLISDWSSDVCSSDLQVDVLGKFPLPVEVIPMARSLVARAIVAATGAQPVCREGVETDHGNWIPDVHGLSITEPLVLERSLNQIPGVVRPRPLPRPPPHAVPWAGDARTTRG